MPTLRRPVVARPRLQGLLDAAGTERVVALVAPPGSGKSTALAQWALARRQDEVRWLRVEARHNAASALASDLCDALRQPPEPESRRDLLTHLRADEGSMGYAFLGSLLAALRAAPPVDVVLEDVQELRNEALGADVAQLIDNAPEGWHFVLAGTQLPPALQRCVRAHGGTTVGAEDLAFEPEEAERLLQAWGLDVTRWQARAVLRRVGSSAIGLPVAALLLEGEPDLAARPQASEGGDPLPSPVARLLERESDRVRSFLLDTSVLERMSPSLCDHVTGSEGSEAMLAALADVGVFLGPDDADPGWHRYHPAFRASVRAVLGEEHPGRERTLLERAAAWHLACDDLDAAVGYLSALGDWDRLVDEVVDRGAVVLHDDRSPIRAWFAALPPEVRARRPEVGLFEAGSAVLRGDAGPVASSIGAIEAADDRGLAAVGEQLRASAAVKQGRMQASLRHSAAAAALLDRSDGVQLPLVRGIVSTRDELAAWIDLVRGIASFGMGDVEGAKQQLRRATIGGDSLWDAGLLGWRSLVDAWSGELSTADRAARRALALATELGLHPHTVTAAHLALAHVAVCRTDLDEADAVLSGLTATGGTDVRPLIGHLLATERARLALAKGEIERGLALLPGDGLRATAPLVHARAKAVEAHLRVAANDIAGARDAIAAAGVDIADIAVARVVVALAVDDDDEAAEVLRRWPSQPAPRAAWEHDVWTAVVAHRRGDAGTAERLLSAVVEQAEPERHLAILRSPRNQVTALTRAVYRTAPSPFVRAAIEGVSWAMLPPAPEMVEPLTEREYEVLWLLPTRLSNEEIADRLHITVNTVKTHVKHVYRKLGVEVRSEAVAEAERLRLL